MSLKTSVPPQDLQKDPVATGFIAKGCTYQAGNRPQFCLGFHSFEHLHLTNLQRLLIYAHKPASCCVTISGIPTVYALDANTHHLIWTFVWAVLDLMDWPRTAQLLGNLKVLTNDFASHCGPLSGS